MFKASLCRELNSPKIRKLLYVYGSAIFFKRIFAIFRVGTREFFPDLPPLQID